MSLSPSEIRAIYVLQSRNVRALSSVRTQLKRTINAALVQGRDSEVQSATCLYALLFCAWSEAQYVQMLHTPAALTGAEIKDVQRQSSIKSKWDRMVQIAFSKAPVTLGDTVVQQRMAAVLGFVSQHIKPMVELRNRLAHGQWVVALNSGGTRESPVLTARLAALDFVRVDLAFELHLQFGRVLRDLMQSPDVALDRDFDGHFRKLQEVEQRGAGWDLASRKQALLTRRPRQQRG